jgi:hypothetical protein
MFPRERPGARGSRQEIVEGARSNPFASISEQNGRIDDSLTAVRRSPPTSARHRCARLHAVGRTTAGVGSPTYAL